MSETSTAGKLRLIQAGVGGHGRGWFFNTSSQSPDFDVVALADPNAEVLAKAADAIDLPPDRCFAELADAVAAVDADAVLSVTPPAVHPQHSELAFANGLHLLVEKPLAESLETARRMVEQADAAGKQLMVGQNRRWDAEPAFLKQIFDEKPYGDFGHAHVDFFLPGDFRGSFRESMRHVLLVDMTVHHIDLARFILGRDVKRVYATDFNPAWSAAGGYYQNGAALRMILTMEDDTVVSYSGDWSAKGRPNSWQGAWRLQCAKGAISFDDRLGGVELATCKAWGGDVEREVRPIPPRDPSQGQLLAAFAESIRTGQPGLTSGRDNLKTVAAVFAAVESCETGRAVEVRA